MMNILQYNDLGLLYILYTLQSHLVFGRITIGANNLHVVLGPHIFIYTIQSHIQCTSGYRYCYSG